MSRPSATPIAPILHRKNPLFLLAALVFGSLTSVSAVTLPQGDLRRDGIADYAPQPNPGRTHNEFWTWQFLLNDGIQVQFNISRVHFGKFKDPVCGADLSIMTPSGRSDFVAREYSMSNFKWEPSAARLAVHANIYAEGWPPREHRVYFSTSKGGRNYLLDLTFEKMIPGVVWGDGLFRLGGGETVSLAIHIPKARVKGRLLVGDDTLTVRGVGWMDHSRQSQFGTRFMDAAYRYVVTSGRTEGGYFFTEKQHVFGYGVREENGVLTLLKPQTIAAPERTSWGGVSVPKLLEFGLDNGDTVRFSRTADRQRTSVLQELGKFERMGARMFLGGELLGYRGLGLIDEAFPALYSFTMVKR
jgi:hypothetical protein